jgi:putative hydrolase of the HAD superfamily
MIDMLAFDADDTLWQNETLYRRTEGRFYERVAAYATPEQARAALYETEMRNLEPFGYGIKAFALSLIETAIALSGGRISTTELQGIVEDARSMAASHTPLIDGVEETLARLAPRYPLMLITKGDLSDQERKLERSGLAQLFTHVEILSRKDRAVYAAILAKHSIRPEGFVMVGNSLRSDILPVVELGGRAVYIPHPLTWAHESDVDPAPTQDYVEIEDIRNLPETLERW